MENNVIETPSTISDVKALLNDDSFNKAYDLGLKYAENNEINTVDTPFCLDKIQRSNSSIVLSNDAIKILEKMKGIAIKQSDTSESKGDHYEASFCFSGKQTGNRIELTKAFWDKIGYIPNKFYDPDSCGMFFFNEAESQTNVSCVFNKKITEESEQTVEDNESAIVIFGHTHYRGDLGKIHNYPSTTDITSAVEESIIYYNPENRCLFLNAIVNADGDLNIFGYNNQNNEFLVYDKIFDQAGNTIPSLTPTNYPITEQDALPIEQGS